VPVLAPAQLANLHGRVVVFRRGMAPVIGRAEMAYQRRDVRELALDPDRRTARARAALRTRCARVWAWRPGRATEQVPVVVEGLHLVPSGPDAASPAVVSMVDDGDPWQRPAIEPGTATGTDDDRDGWS
jgi:hypothetical protein